MRYMLLIYLAEDAMTDGEREHCYMESAQLAQDIHAAGQYLAAAPLHPVSTATSVRVREGQSLLTDGPFAETREQLGGYYLIEAKESRRGDRHCGTYPPGESGHHRDPASIGDRRLAGLTPRVYRRAFRVLWHRLALLLLSGTRARFSTA